MDIVERIDELCRARKINKYELERLLGFGHGSIQKWSAHIPKADNILKVAQFFGISMEYLMTGDDLPTAAGYQISPFEYQIIEAYRSSDMKDAVLTLLNLRPEAKKQESIIS